MHWILLLQFVWQLCYEFRDLDSILSALAWHISISEFFRRRNIASLWLFYKSFDGNCSCEPSSFVIKLNEFKQCKTLAARSRHFTVNIATCNRKFCANSFFTRSSHLWNSLPAFCFLVNFDLQKIWSSKSVW